MYVTDIKDDGEVIVSSLKEKYTFDDNDALWKSKVLIKIRTNRK